MSQENLDVVRRWIAATSAGPQGARAAIAELWDADAEYYPARKFPEAQPCHGAGEVSQFFSRWLETWSRLDWTVRDLLDMGDDRVLACLTMHAEGRGSGMKLEADLYLCAWLRRGRLIRQEDHLTLRGALHALGFEGGTLEAVGLRE
jgi:hypothetical protein